MKSSKEIQDSVGELTSTEIIRLRHLMKEIEFLIENPKINEDNLKVCSNILEEARGIRELYMSRIMTLYRRGFMLD